MKKLIENIFSFKPTKQTQLQKPQIIIDTREKQSLVASFLSKESDIRFEFLKIGDYLIKNIIIERKTIQDFINSIFNKRLFQQLIEIKKYPEYIILLEGNQEYLKEKNSKLLKPLRGMVLSIITNYKIPIIFTKNEKETADYLLLLAKKLIKKDYTPNLRPSKNFLSKEQQKQFILEGFPGIGPTTAKQLLKEFKTLKKIFTADEKELEKILGKKTIQFTELLNQ